MTNLTINPLTKERMATHDIPSPTNTVEVAVATALAVEHLGRATALLAETPMTAAAPQYQGLVTDHLRLTYCRTGLAVLFAEELPPSRTPTTKKAVEEGP